MQIVYYTLSCTFFRTN